MACESATTYVDQSLKSLQHDNMLFGHSSIFNAYSMKQTDLFYFETIKMTSQASQILYGEYDLQASILCEL